MKLIKNSFSWNDIQSNRRLMIVLVFILNLLTFSWEKKVFVDDYWGRDGVFHTNIVRNFDSGWLI